MEKQLPVRSEAYAGQRLEDHNNVMNEGVIKCGPFHNCLMN